MLKPCLTDTAFNGQIIYSGIG